MLSIIQKQSLAYPDGEDFYSPFESYPEYAHGLIARQPNQVYQMVRECFVQAGLDAAHYGAPEWNPLGDLVPTGSKVFVLCNFVHHRRPIETQQQFFSKCTHGSVVRALIDYLLIAVGKEGRVHFGNAPLQSCNWLRVLQETGADRVAEFYQQRGLPVEVCDLRLFIAERDLLGRVTHVEQRNESDLAVSVELRQESLLAEIDLRDHSAFRVTEYDPERIEAFHRDGRHVYVLNRLVLESDVIFSAPKLKTHEKVGITCSLKGCVGAIGHKDCLAHRRFGPPEKGGDEYPADRFGLLQARSKFHDYVYRSHQFSAFGGLLRVLDRNLHRVQNRLGQTMPGGWWGNDTAWRMVLDIARIIGHADVAGRLHNGIVRPHYVLIDGIIGGEGNGPLSPNPVTSGIIMFGTDLAVSDVGCALIMRFDPSRIPLIKHAFGLDEYTLTDSELGVGEVMLNGKRLLFSELSNYFHRLYKPPRGWQNYVELERGFSKK